MKYWVIRLTLIIGSYEKTGKWLIQAHTKGGAIKKALEAECHDKPDYEEFPCKTACWDCGEFIYKVSKIQEVDQKVFDILKQYM